jgi:hypothetical protein
LKKTRNEAWDERFDHIAAHFKKKSIDLWLCVEAKKTKGEVRAEKSRVGFEEEGEGDMRGLSPDSQESGSVVVNAQHIVVPNTGESERTRSSRSSSGSSSSENSRKRAADSEVPAAPPEHKRSVRRVVLSYCVRSSSSFPFSFFLFPFVAGTWLTWVWGDSVIVRVGLGLHILFRVAWSVVISGVVGARLMRFCKGGVEWG